MSDPITQKPLRLLHVFSTFSVGGPQIRFAQMVNKFDIPMEHIILAMDGRYECMELLPSSADVSKSLCGPVSGSLLGRVRHYRREIKKLRPDRLITYNWGAIEWAAANFLSLCPHIHVEDGFGPEEAGGQIRRRVLFRRLVLSGHIRTVLPSRTLLSLATDVWRLPKQRLSYIPNGIDFEPYGAVSKLESRAAFGLPHDRLIIGTLATLRAEKNLKRLIEAFQRVRKKTDCHLVIAGDGRERCALEACVRDLGLENVVSFPGFIEDPHTILPAFDVFALSSDTEQMPLSIMEAMAAGLPIASLDVGDIRQMVAKETRPYVNGRDTAALATSLRELLGCLHVREKSGEANRILAENEFGAAKMLASWKNLFIYG